MELLKYPHSCAVREQPPPYMDVDVDLEQQQSTDLPAYQDESNRAGASEPTQSNVGVCELPEPRPCPGVNPKQILTKTNLNSSTAESESEAEPRAFHLLLPLQLVWLLAGVCSFYMFAALCRAPGCCLHWDL